MEATTVTNETAKRWKVTIIDDHERSRAALRAPADDDPPPDPLADRIACRLAGGRPSRPAHLRAPGRRGERRLRRLSAPLSTSDASAYWDGVAETVRGGSRVLLVARAPDGRRIVGTAQLALGMRPNGMHRAEVTKVMVLREARREGIGRALMAGWTPTPSTTGSWTRASDVIRATRGPASLRLSFRDAWRVT